MNKFLLSVFISIFTSTLAIANQERQNIYVANISWHTAIIVPASILPDSIWPAGHDYSQFNYLEIGWGDREFYQDEGFNPICAIKALFISTPTALHLFPLESIEKTYFNHYVVALEVNKNQVDQLARFLLGHFQFNQDRKVIPLNNGLYYNSQFFAGSGQYHFPINSNVWVAQALKEAGFNICPPRYQATEWLIRKAAKWGEVVVRP